MRRLFLIYIIMCAAIGVNAQEELTPSQQINVIKRDSTFVYAEATDTTMEQAYNAANVQLMLEIKNFILSQRELQDADMVLIKDKAAKCERIEMPRGDKFRVFVYVKKEGIMSAQTVTYLPKSAWQAMEGTKNQNDSAAVEEAEEDVTPLEKTGFAATPMQTHEAVTATYLKDWQKILLSNMLNCANLNDCLIFLNKMKIQNKVKRVGDKEKSPQNPQQAFYAIFSADDKLVTVLGKDENGSRINFMTNQNDSLNNHSAEKQIWFTLSNF